MPLTFLAILESAVGHDFVEVEVSHSQSCFRGTDFEIELGHFEIFFHPMTCATYCQCNAIKVQYCRYLLDMWS